MSMREFGELLKMFGFTVQNTHRVQVPFDDGDVLEIDLSALLGGDVAEQEGRPDWAAVLGLEGDQWRTITKDDLTKRYRALARVAHPDRSGGSHEAMQRLNVAFQEARKARGF